MKRALVTGGAGFIGSNLVSTLVEQGVPVRVLDNFSYGKKENLASVIGRIELIEGDLRDKEAVKQAVADVEVIFHQGALRSVPKSVDDPEPYNDVNVTGTLNLLMAAKEAGVRRVVSASSSSVYGDNPELPKVETQYPFPISPYAASKLATEGYCQTFSAVYGLSTVSLRYFNVFGPRQDPGSEYAVVIPAFITAILDDKAPTIHGDGLQSRDFTYIDDVVQANILAGTAPGLSGQALNIACGANHTVLDIVKHTNKILGKDVKPQHIAARQGDVRHTLADITAARKLIRFEPKVMFEEGLQRTIEWFQKQS
ncbi:MAG: SDR family oxidoreductase [Candidatus Omnitrophica bacterium]|nr:SDR family oxidoreductase [Candidatus Omnitrophota bacterium]